MLTRCKEEEGFNGQYNHCYYEHAPERIEFVKQVGRGRICVCVCLASMAGGGSVWLCVAVWLIVDDAAGAVVLRPAAESPAVL